MDAEMTHSPPRAVVRCIIDDDVEELTLEFLSGVPSEAEWSQAARDVYLTLYNGVLLGPIAAARGGGFLALKSDSPTRPSSEELRSQFLGYPRARTRVAAFVREDGTTHLSAGRIGGPNDNIRVGQGDLLEARIAGLLAARLLDEIAAL